MNNVPTATQMVNNRIEDGRLDKDVTDVFKNATKVRNSIIDPLSGLRKVNDNVQKLADLARGKQYLVC